MRNDLIQILGFNKITVAEIILKEQKVAVQLILVIRTKTEFSLNLFLDSVA